MSQTLAPEKRADVPEEYRRYIKRQDISRLPQGTRIHRGPRGGLFIDIREIPEHMRREFEPRTFREEGEALSAEEEERSKAIDIMDKFTQGEKFASVNRLIAGMMRDMELRGYPVRERYRRVMNQVEMHLTEVWLNVLRLGWASLGDTPEKIKSGLEEYVSNLVEDLEEYYGKEYADFVRQYGKMLVIFRQYGTAGYDTYLPLLEALERRRIGDRRKGFSSHLTEGKRDKEQILMSLAGVVSEEEYENWVKLSQLYFKKKVLKRKESVRLYRGLSGFEANDLLLRKILGRPMRLPGYILSTTVDYNVAKKFGRVIVWLEERGDRVIGGWWSAYEEYDSREKEVVLAGDKDGTKIDGLDFEDSKEASVWLAFDKNGNVDYVLWDSYPETLFALWIKLTELTRHYYNTYHKFKGRRDRTMITEQQMEQVYDKTLEVVSNLTRRFMERVDTSPLEEKAFADIVGRYMNALYRLSKFTESRTGVDENPLYDDLRNVASPRMKEKWKQFENNAKKIHDELYAKYAEKVYRIESQR
jgi:hypothetical protein